MIGTGHNNMDTGDNIYLFTIEPDGGHCIGVLAILESVEDRRLATAIQTNHDTVISSRGAKGDQALERLFAHPCSHDDIVSLFCLCLLASCCSVYSLNY